MSLLLKFFSWLADAFEDHRGGTSFQRLATCLIVSDVMTIWTMSCFAGDTVKLVPMDGYTASIIFVGLGVNATKSLLETSNVTLVNPSA